MKKDLREFKIGDDIIYLKRLRAEVIRLHPGYNLLGIRIYHRGVDYKKPVEELFSGEFTDSDVSSLYCEKVENPLSANDELENEYKDFIKGKKK